jgi:hypothetical protein
MGQELTERATRRRKASTSSLEPGDSCALFETDETTTVGFSASSAAARALSMIAGE